MSSNTNDFINQWLLQYQEVVYKYERRISLLVTLIAVGLVFYRYGFYLTTEEIESVVTVLGFIFVVYELAYLARFIFSNHRLTFLKSTWIEGCLLTLLTFNGLMYSFFGIRIIQQLFRLLWLDNPFQSYANFLFLYLIILIGIETTKISVAFSELKIKPSTTFISSFIFLILFGTFCLMLPGASVGESSMGFLDAIFTSVSASCVTGLAVVDTGQFFTFKGKIVILFLAQVGGIGIVSFATFFATFMSKGVSLKHKTIIQDVLSSEDLSSATGLLRKVIFLTLLIESLGAVFIYFSWDRSLVFDNHFQKVFYSIFHSVSAFCNAGFSLFPDSLNTYILSSDTTQFNTPNTVVDLRHMYGLHLVIGIIIIFGSFGFTTIEEIFSPAKIKDRIKNPWKKYSIGTSISLYSTILLILLGMVAVFFLEIDQLREDRTLLESLIASFFQSVTTRTAGFNSMDFGSMKPSTIIVMIFLMFIGAAPGSTGGGIKSSTFYVLLLSSIGIIRGRQRMVVRKRTISDDNIKRSYSIFMFAVIYNMVAIFLLTITESGNSNIEILPLVFEEVSAFGTAGLSMGVTGELSSLGKVIIILSMYIGRVGTLTLALALSSTVKTNNFQYPEAHVMVG
ncbi:TrkH family potassium uptake protein [Flammeovirga kamogawensis]|uniref:Trk-type K+ transporter membrane component n=1 Tax=Flammeovirga kamogawensis TaxID=373891 RepID=A0ABX8GWR4_9BACT|nr:potassium transporter TrkG [Flammeovirga kamogawensis]MBB6460685.1 potassium uptake TrkH family protein [Flammeovirga kamogawensis]QWG08040.1 Trk-type K+ transporter membrane component [Flammeovirga kamogawensis]TRX69847.1 Trk-type K+ transporter membrane component [Flammeovirga kamogawensis]